MRVYSYNHELCYYLTVLMKREFVTPCVYTIPILITILGIGQIPHSNHSINFFNILTIYRYIALTIDLSRWNHQLYMKIEKNKQCIIKYREIKTNCSSCVPHGKQRKQRIPILGIVSARNHYLSVVGVIAVIWLHCICMIYYRH